MNIKHEPTLERVRVMIRQSALTYGHIASECGISTETISKFVSGQTKAIRKSNLVNILKVFGYQLDMTNPHEIDIEPLPELPLTTPIEDNMDQNNVSSKIFEYF